MKRVKALLCTVFILAGCAGCAKSPTLGTASNTRQISVTMTVAGQLNPNYYYFVVFNNANDSSGSSGPDPVIAPPWGNGFVAGSATQFMEYSSTQPGDGYLLYSFATGTQLQQFTPIGVPAQDTPVAADGNTLQFRFPLSQLATTAVPSGSINYLQINLIATDRLPVNPNDTSPKLFDAFGDSHPGTGQLNDYITIPTQQDGTFNNTSNPIEPTGDVEQTNGSGGYSPVNQPDLDITNWSVQITG